MRGHHGAGHPDAAGRVAPACGRRADGNVTTLQQYLRRCDLNIGGLLIQETLRVVFSIRLGGDASQQPSTIRVYNLATATASTITEKDTPVMLQAGYADTPLGLLYEGQVRPRGYRAARAGPDKHRGYGQHGRAESHHLQRVLPPDCLARPDTGYCW